MRVPNKVVAAKGGDSACQGTYHSVAWPHPEKAFGTKSSAIDQDSLLVVP